MACFILLLAALAALHLLSPDSDPVHRRLSEYAVGSLGFLMTAVFALACAGLLALSDALRRAAVPASPWLRLGCLALLSAAVMNGLMAVFAADSTLPDASGRVAVSLRGRMHDVFAISHAFCWCVAIVSVPLGMLQDSKWRHFALRSALAGATIALAMSVRVFSPSEWIGLTQRMWIGGVLIWCVTHAVELRRHAG